VQVDVHDPDLLEDELAGQLAYDEGAGLEEDSRCSTCGNRDLRSRQLFVTHPSG
jgi:hypothetical protein